MVPHCSTVGCQALDKDVFWPWVVCASATFSTVIILGVPYSFAVVMPLLMEHLDESRRKIAWVGSIATCLTLFASPLAGILISKLNYRKVAIVGSIICGISLVITSLVSTTLQMIFSYSILYGLGSCFVYNGAVYAVAAHFEQKKKLALAIFGMNRTIGFLCLGPLTQAILSAFGSWRIMYRILAGLTGLSFLLTFTFTIKNAESRSQAVKESTNENVKQSKQPILSKNVEEACVEDKHIIVVEKHKQSTRTDLPVGSKRQLLLETIQSPTYILAVLTLVIEALSASTIFVHLVKVCIEASISASEASHLFICIGACSLASCLVSGWFLDTRLVNPFHINQASAVFMGVTMLLLPRASGYCHFVALSVFLGIGYGGFQATLLVLLFASITPRLVFIGYPIGQCAIAIAVASGAPLIGFIADTYGSYGPAYYTAGCVMLAAALLPLLQYCSCFKHRKNPEHRMGSSVTGPSDY